MEEDRVGNKLRVLLDNLLDLGLLEVLLETILDVQDDLRTTSNAGPLGVELNSERTTSTGLPQVLL